jgi:ribosome-associated translation inhibitor RaiA
MHIQVNTDRHVAGHEAMAADVTETLRHALGRFATQITRLEVHLSDENGAGKGGGNDIRCLIEARLEGLQPVAARHQAATAGQAVEGAAAKLMRALDSLLGRLRDTRLRPKDGLPGDA